MPFQFEILIGLLQKSSRQMVAINQQEQVLVEKVSEQERNAIELLVNELPLALDSTFAQDFVRVGCQDLGHRELADVEVHEILEREHQLPFEAVIFTEAFVDHAAVMQQHFDHVFDELRVRYDDFDGQIFAVCGSLCLTNQLGAHFYELILEALSDWLQTILDRIVQIVEKLQRLEVVLIEK